MSVEVMEFDKKNKQEDFQYMAKSIESGEYVIGYIVIDKPWYSNENDWTYYIVQNVYGGGGFCGGATDLGLKKIIVDRDTVEPFTQTANIKFNQTVGIDSRLIEKFDFLNNENEKEIITIKAFDEIPYELWR